MEVLVELFIKSSVVLGMGLLFSWFARKQSASLRHLLLWMSLVGLLLLPFLLAFGPSWQTSFLPGPEAEQLLVNVTGMVPVSDDSSSWWGLAMLWALAAGILLMRLLMGLYGASRLTGKGTVMNGRQWRQIFQMFRQKLILKRDVRLVKNKGVRVPMTWGLFNPVVLMPPDSSQWPIEQCSSVLFHELSHIKRKDFTITVFSLIARALFWFNPLSWLVFDRLRKEQEKACDEMVLKTGIKPSDYASALLKMKQSLNHGFKHPLPALAMVRSSQIEKRLTTILDKHFKVKEIRMKTKMMLTMIVILTVVLIGTAAPAMSVAQTDSMETPPAVTEKKEKPEKPEEPTKVSEPVVAPEPVTMPEPATLPEPAVAPEPPTVPEPGFVSAVAPVVPVSPETLDVRDDKKLRKIKENKKKKKLKKVKEKKEKKRLKKIKKLKKVKEKKQLKKTKKLRKVKEKKEAKL